MKAYFFLSGTSIGLIAGCAFLVFAQPDLDPAMLENGVSHRTVFANNDESHGRQQEQGQKQQDKEEVRKLKQKLAAKSKDHDMLQKVNDRVVKRLMRVVHRGSHSPLVELEQAIKQGDTKTDWDQLKSSADFVTIMADALANKGGEEGYTKAAKSILQAAEKKDFKSLAESVKALSVSCSSCHGWAPPK